MGVFGENSERRTPNAERRDRVVAATAPRMTAADPFRGEITARDGTVQADGFNRVLRTGGRETAAARGTKEKKLRGRNRPAIRADGGHQDMLGWIHGCFSKPARRSDAK